MRILMACFILGSLTGITPPLLPAQQNQTPQQLAQEFKVLKSKVSELEKQIHNVENVEKMELVKNYTDVTAKLAEANAKLLNAEFANMERELRDSNTKWLTGWILFFVAILTAVGIVVVREFRSSADKLIKNEVEKRLNGFKEAMDQVDIIKQESKESLNQLKSLQDQQGILEKQHAVSALESIIYTSEWSRRPYPERIKRLSDEALLQVFDDEKCDRSSQIWRRRDSNH